MANMVLVDGEELARIGDAIDDLMADGTLTRPNEIGKRLDDLTITPAGDVLAVLKKCEWTETSYKGITVLICPVRHSIFLCGHAPDCALDALLKKCREVE